MFSLLAYRKNTGIFMNYLITVQNISQWSRDWAEARGIPYTYSPVTDSTSLLARRSLSTLSEPFHLFITGRQTNGRGQNTNIWLESDLMASWLWKKTKPFKQKNFPPDFTSDLLNSMTSLWKCLPFKRSKTNDIFLKDKKIAGLLLEILEQNHQQALILGLGVNVFSHPPHINAGHLTEYLNPLTIEEWHEFLNLLHSAWSDKVNSFS